MVEQEIYTKFLASDLDRILAANKGKPYPKFQKKVAQVCNQGAFQIPLTGFFSEGEKLEIVRVLDDLLSKL